MPDIVIHETVEADFYAVAQLVTRLGYPSTGERILARMANLAGRRDVRVWVAEADGRVVGLTGVFLQYAPEYDGAYGRLPGLVVDEPFRGKGIGAHLMGWPERWLRDHGVDKLTLAGGIRRTAAHEFYKQLGCERTGFRFGKMPDCRGPESEKKGHGESHGEKGDAEERENPPPSRPAIVHGPWSFIFSAVPSAPRNGAS